MNRINEQTTLGFFRNNPVLGFALGITTALGVTFSMTSALGMGILTFILMILAAVLGGVIRMIAPKEAVLPVNIIIVAFLAKLGELMVLAFAPALASGVGVFLPLLAVSSIILYAAGAFTPEHSVGESMASAVKAGLYYVGALLCVAFFRELLGTGGIALQNPMNGNEILAFDLIPSQFTLGLFTQPAGALLVVGLVAALFAALSGRNEEMGGK